MADPMFEMTVEQLLDEAGTQVFIARRAKGKAKRAAAVRLESIAHLLNSYLVLGFPEPRKD